MRHFPPAKAEGDFHLIAVFEELIHLPKFHVVIVRVDIRAHFDFFDVDGLLLLPRLGGFLLGLELVFPVIENLTDGGFCSWGDFNEVKPARATVAVKELPKGALVEIDCIATR